MRTAILLCLLAGCTAITTHRHVRGAATQSRPLPHRDDAHVLQPEPSDSPSEDDELTDYEFEDDDNLSGFDTDSQFEDDELTDYDLADYSEEASDGDMDSDEPSPAARADKDDEDPGRNGDWKTWDSDDCQGMSLNDVYENARRTAILSLINSEKRDFAPTAALLERSQARLRRAEHKRQEIALLLSQHTALLKAGTIMIGCLNRADAASKEAPETLAICLLSFGGETAPRTAEDVRAARNAFWDESVAAAAAAHQPSDVAPEPARIAWALLRGVAVGIIGVRYAKCNIPKSHVAGLSFIHAQEYEPVQFKPAWAKEDDDVISFSWEREGTSRAILNLYGPEEEQQARWKHSPAFDPLTERWFDANDGAVEQGGRAWTHMSLERRRALMISNGKHFKDLRRLDWEELDCFTQYFLAYKRVSAKPGPQGQPQLMGDVLFNSLSPQLESEVSDQYPYKARVAIPNTKNYRDLTFQEILGENMGARRVWETKHRGSERDLNVVIAAIAALSTITFDGKLGADAETSLLESFDISEADSSVQVHLVFPRPDVSDGERRHWASKVAALGYLLNDRCAITSYAGMVNRDWSVMGALAPKSIFSPGSSVSNSALQSPFLGPYAAELKPDLINLLSQARMPSARDCLTTSNSDAGCLEQTDEDGHQVGPWKFGCVAVRHHYDRPELLGFEFRSSVDPFLGNVLWNTASLLQDREDWLREEGAPARVWLAAPSPYPPILDFHRADDDDEEAKGIPYPANDLEAPGLPQVAINEDDILTVSASKRLTVPTQFEHYVLRCIATYTHQRRQEDKTYDLWSPTFTESTTGLFRFALRYMVGSELPVSADSEDSEVPIAAGLYARFAMAFLPWEDHPVARAALAHRELGSGASPHLGGEEGLSARRKLVSASDTIKKAQTRLQRHVDYVVQSPTLLAKTSACMTVLSGMLGDFFQHSKLAQLM